MTTTIAPTAAAEAAIEALLESDTSCFDDIIVLSEDALADFADATGVELWAPLLGDFQLHGEAGNDSFEFIYEYEVRYLRSMMAGRRLCTCGHAARSHLNREGCGVSRVPMLGDGPCPCPGFTPADGEPVA